MAHRLIMRVVLTGGQVFGKAFAEAYKQASSASVAHKANAAVRERTGGLSLDEACKILNVEPNNLTREAMQKQYEHLFEANSKEKSGSFYLQSKVYRSMERISYELEKNAQKGEKS